MYIKTEIALVNDIKAGQELARQRISQREKSDIIQAMNEEARMGIHNIVGGRWFVCPNGHPYYIGTGLFLTIPLFRLFIDPITLFSR